MRHIYIPHLNECKLKIGGRRCEETPKNPTGNRFKIDPENNEKRNTPWESHQIISGPDETEHHLQTFHFQTVSLLR